MGSGTASPVQAGPVAAQQTITQNLVVSPCPAYLTGTLVDCNGDPTEGIVQAAGTVGYGYAVVQNGVFRIRVQPNASLSVSALGYNGGAGEPMVVQQVTSGTTYSIGNVELCPQNAIPFTDINFDIYTYSTVLSPDGSLLVLGGTPYSKVYDAASGALLQTLDSANRVEFSRDGSKLMITSQWYNYGEIKVLSTSTWQEIQKFPKIQEAVFFPDGNTILTLTKSSSGTVAVQYSLATGTEIKRYAMPGIEYSKLVGITDSGRQFVYTTYTPSAKFVVWDMGSNTLVREISWFGKYTYNPLLSHDASLLINPSRQKVELYTIATGQRAYTLSNAKNYGSSFALSPNNSHYAVQEYPLPAALHTVANGNRVRILPSPAQQRFSAFAYSSNGKRLVGRWRGSSNAAKARIWHLP